MAEATIALIPGAGGDSGYWYLVEPILRAAGWHVVAPDLPAGDDAAGVGEYADAVLAHLPDRGPIILVAQSLGGYTAAAVAERREIALIVFVNAMIPADDTAGEWWEVTGQDEAQRTYAAEEGRDPDAAFDLMSTFMHDVSPEVRAAVLDRGETPQSMTPFETPNTWSAWRNVAARSVVGTRDRLFPVTFQRALSAERLGSAPIELEGGHLLALSKSRELAAAIDDLARAHRSAGVRRR